MKKLILMIALVGIAGIFALSVWGSLRAQQAYRALPLWVAESPDMRILDTSYEQGWLQSRARADVELHGRIGQVFQRWMIARGRDEVRPRVGVRIRHTIEHGYTPLLDWLTSGMEGTPIVGRVETLLELDNETQSEVAAVIGRLPPVTILTLIRASGVSESSVMIPAQRLERSLASDEGGGWLVDWKGLRGAAVHTSDFGHVAANFRSDGLEGTSANSSFALHDLVWTADLTVDESGLLVGDLSTSVGSLQLASAAADAAPIELDQLAMKQSNLVQTGSFASSLRIRVQTVRFGDQSFGPGEADLALQNLDAVSLARLQSQGLAGFVPSESQAVQQASNEMGSITWLSGLFSRSPQLEVRALRLTTPSGDIEATLRIDLDASHPVLLRNLLTLPLALAARVEFGCPAEVLEVFYRTREDELEELRQAGWLLLEEDRYRSHLEVERGDLTVNGLPKSLVELLGEPQLPDELPQLSAIDSGSEAVAPGPELLP